MAGNAVESGRTVTSKVTAILMVVRRRHRMVAVRAGADHQHPADHHPPPRHRARRGPAAGALVRRVPRRAGPGPAAARPSPTGGPTVAQLAPAVLDDLAAVTGRPVRLGVLRDTAGGLRREVRSRTSPPPSPHGAQLPLHASALGKVLLAFAPAAVTRSLVATGLPRFTPRTLTRADQLLHALSVTRLTRIATCDGELVAGETTVAAPVVGPGGRVVAALETDRAGPARSRLRAAAPDRLRTQHVPRAGGPGAGGRRRRVLTPASSLRG